MKLLDILLIIIFLGSLIYISVNMYAVSNEPADLTAPEESGGSGDSEKKCK